MTEFYSVLLSGFLVLELSPCADARIFGIPTLRSDDLRGLRQPECSVG